MALAWYKGHWACVLQEDLNGNIYVEREEKLPANNNCLNDGDALASGHV